MGKSEKNRVLAVNVRASLIGGKFYTPIDLEASLEEETSVFVDEPFSKKGDDVFLANVAVSLRRNRPKATHEFKIDVQNATNNQARLSEYFDEATGKKDYNTQLSLLPNISYRISF